MNEGVEWGTVAQWFSPLVAIVVAIWAVWRASNKEALDGLSTQLTNGLTAVRGDIKDLRADDARAFQRIDVLEAEVTGMKVEQKHLVTKDELHALDKQLSRIDEKIDRKFEALSDKMDTVIAQTERAQDRLAQREDNMIARLKEHKDSRA